MPDELKKAFPNVKPVQRPKVTDQKIKDPATVVGPPWNGGGPQPHWVAGFVDGEGCFYVALMGSSTHKLGSRVQLRFLITQHIRDEQLIKSLVNYLSCGKVYKGSKRDVVDFVVTRFPDLSGKIVPGEAGCRAPVERGGWAKPAQPFLIYTLYKVLKLKI